MAPKTPQANSKLPKPPTAGGPIPLAGIPAPASVLQRRTFTSTPASSSVSKAFKDMTPEQQALLAEAISMHSPGLIDPSRKTNTATTTNNTTGTAGFGSQGSTFGHGSAMVGHLAQHSQQHHPSVAPTSNADRASPTLTSPSSSRPTIQQLTRRPSSSRLAMSPETPPPVPTNNHSTTLPATAIAGIGAQQLSRPSSYTGMSPLSTTLSSLPTASSTPSPTTPVGMSRVGSGSPSGARPTLPTSRLSAGASAGTGAAAGGIARSSLMKQPLFQRPPGTTAATASARTPLSTVPGSGVIAPPSLDNYDIGDRVIVESMALSGYLRFLGPTEFKSGTWAGIELDTPTGKNDGSVGGVEYFRCRPKCGIFVLAAKIVKSELLFPASPELTTAQPPAAAAAAAAQEVCPALQPEPVSHAAQAASKITAGSRASKYIGMTASQLKQRNVLPQLSTTTSNSSLTMNSRLPGQGQPGLPGTSLRASSPTIRSLSGISGSPTGTRTITPGTTNGRANSPSPVPKPIIRSSSPTTRTTLGARLSQTGTKTTLANLASKAGAHSRSTSSTSSVTSQSSANGTRTRTSPTPRTMTTPRRLSSRSETPDVTSILSPSESRSNLLDQVTTIQLAGSPQDNVSLQLQQLQLDFDTAVAENNLLKSEMSEAKSQLETVKLLEKKDLSYEERVFLSKNLGREAMDERLAQELEDLHALKAVWDKERAAKDQEIKVVTDKMTQAWLDAARSQKERAALIQEKSELAEKLKRLQESGDVATDAEQQPLVESLQQSLREADERSNALEAKIQELAAKATEEEERLNRAIEENNATNEAKSIEWEAERERLQAALAERDFAAKSDSEAIRLQLKAALEEAAAAKDQLKDAQALLETEVEARRQGLFDSESRLKAAESELQESRSLLAKGEKVARNIEEKAKDLEVTVSKREQEIASLKLELQEFAGMVQSEEVDRMRKMFEHDKMRLEEAISDNLTLIATQQAQIQALETNEEELSITINTLEKSQATLTELKTTAETNVARLQKCSEDASEAFEQERLTLAAKIAESEATMENRLSENKERMEQLEAVALSVEEWKESCEAMQFEMIQKTAMVEDVGFKLAEAQAQQEALKQENADIKKALEDKQHSSTIDHAAELESSRAEVAILEEEREQLLVKVSELEAALALSASAPRATSSTTTDSESVLNRSELEEEIAGLKQMVHELTAENASVASDNKKLMQEHDILMEAHKHVETECLKLMDEVERLHSESLAVTSIGETDGVGRHELDAMHHGTEPKAHIIGQHELKMALNDVAGLTKDTGVLNPMEKQSGQNQSASVIRLEGLLKDKQAMLDRLTQAHALEMRDLRQRYVELDRSKTWELNQLNKELTELESLIESKIFHEADLEEEVQKKQKQIDRLQHEVQELKSQLAKLSGGAFTSPNDLPPNGVGSDRHAHISSSSLSGSKGIDKTPTTSERNSAAGEGVLFCEICEVEGHDLISCVAVFGGSKPKAAPAAASSLFASIDQEDDDRPYCENCEEFGLHYTDECPNESLTY